MGRAVAVVSDTHGFDVRPIRGRDRLLARLCGWWLDTRLAAGLPPESSWLRAVRATELTSPAARARLADGWNNVLARVDQPDGTRRVVPLPSTSIRAAAGNIALLIERLGAQAPVSARGVAMAAVLLTDGTGPLHRPQSPEHLAAAVTAVNRHLDGTTPLRSVTKT